MRFLARPVCLLLLSLAASGCGPTAAPAQPQAGPAAPAATGAGTPTAAAPTAAAPTAAAPTAAAPAGVTPGTDVNPSPALASGAPVGSSAPTSNATASSAAQQGPCPAGMALVAGGEFKRAGSASPKQLVDLCVDVLEATPPQYEACVQAGQCNTQGLDCSAQSTYGKPDKLDRPVVCLIFEQAEAYCKYRGMRLPSTEEWEWVARSGKEARVYSWGNAAPDEQLCWAGKRKQTESCAVGSFPQDRTAHGVLDMAGNVLEFTTTDADKSSQVRIARGGSWNVGAPELFRNSRLGGFGLDYRCGFLGVRCVVPAAP